MARIREIETEFDKKLKRNIADVKRGVKNLKQMGLRVEIDKGVETMVGTTADNIYVADYMAGRVILQKHLFTIYEEREVK